MIKLTEVDRITLTDIINHSTLAIANWYANDERLSYTSMPTIGPVCQNRWRTDLLLSTLQTSNVPQLNI